MEITNVILRKCKGKVYYFNEKGIYVSRPMSAKEQEFYGNRVPVSLDYEICDYFSVSNRGLLAKSIKKLEVGKTIEDLRELINDTHFDHREKPSGIERFIGKIQSPNFERYPENPNKNTFDMIRIYIDFVAYMEPETSWINYFKENKSIIFDKVIEFLENNKRFKKYGIPVNYLKLSYITLTKNQPGAVFLFELKKV